MQIDGTQIIVAAVGLVFTAVVVPLVHAGIAWLKGRTQNEAMRAALAEAQRVADGVVASLQATVVDGLKAGSADGKLSAGEVREVAGMAIEMFISDISARSLALLEENADDVAAYIGNLIEARLAQLKRG